MKQLFFQEKVREDLEKILNLSEIDTHSKEFKILVGNLTNTGNLTRIIKPKGQIDYALGYSKIWKNKLP